MFVWTFFWFEPHTCDGDRTVIHFVGGRDVHDYDEAELVDIGTSSTIEPDERHVARDDTAVERLIVPANKASVMRHLCIAVTEKTIWNQVQNRDSWKEGA